MTFLSGEIYQISMMYPLYLYNVDIQGAQKLVGVFDLYSKS